MHQTIDEGECDGSREEPDGLGPRIVFFAQKQNHDAAKNNANGELVNQSIIKSVKH